MISRLRRFLTQDSDSRFRVLFGTGVEDQYLWLKKEPQDFEHAILACLKETGYRRVVFIAPHKPVYFLDLESKKLTLLKSEPSNGIEKPQSDANQLEGPLGGLNLLAGRQRSLNQPETPN